MRSPCSRPATRAALQDRREIPAPSSRGQHLRQLVLALRKRVGHHGQQAGRGMRLAGLFQRPLNSRLEANNEAAIVLELVLRPEDLRLGRVHLGHVGLRRSSNASLTGPLLGAAGEQVDEVVELALVIEQQMPRAS
jgi:hypothetical protein